VLPDDFSCLVTIVIERFFVVSADDSRGEFHRSPGQAARRDAPPWVKRDNILSPVRARYKPELRMVLKAYTYSSQDFAHYLQFNDCSAQITDGDAAKTKAIEDAAAVGAAGTVGEQHGIGHGVDGAVAETVIG
jgi:hypothetical protein